MSKSLLSPFVLVAVLLVGCSSGVAPSANTMALAPLMPAVTLTAAANSVASGATTTLTWSSTDATTCTATGAWAGSKGTSGSEVTAAINADSTYTLSCSGAGGTAMGSTTVTIVTTPSVTLSAAPTAVAIGGSSTLTWGSANVTACTATGGWSGAQPNSGSAPTAAINASTTYTLTCTGPGGNASASATVTIAAAPTATLSASPSAVSSGDSSTLSWSSTNASNCAATGGWSGSTTLSGTVLVGPLSSSTTYTLTCTGAGGQAATTATVTVGAATVTVSPRLAALTLKQTQQFTAMAPGGGAVTWSVDGVTGGNVSAGTISANGLYVPPQAAGTHSITATSAADSSLFGTVSAVITDLAGVYTYHNDLARTGQNLQEYALTKAWVSGGNFGKRWSCALDGDVYAQPLYVANLPIAGGTHNVVFIATNHDSVYAFDGDSGSCTPLWKTSFLTGSATTIPASTYSCSDSLDEYGIVGTPVIDPASGTLYVVATTKEGSNYFQRLHALDITTGIDKASPKVLAPSYPWSGGTRTFDPKMQLQRAGLVYSGGSVFVAWSSHCDDPVYYGWIASYDGTSLQQVAAFNVAPQGAQGGIWMSGAAPAIDSSGAIYLSTGNGSFTNTSGGLPATPPANDFSMSFLNFDPSTLTLNDFYTPSQQAAWSVGDFDISAPGVMVLPDTLGPKLLYGGDKQGHIWLLNRLGLGDYSPGSDNVVQMLDVVNLAATGNQVLYTPPALFNNSVFASPVSRPVQAMTLSAGQFSFTLNTSTNRNEVVAQSFTADRCNFPGCGISISAAGSSQAIAWTLDNAMFGHANISTSIPLGPAVLRAYDATNLATRLFTSSASANDTSGNALKFTLPMIANGHVYVGGVKQLTVYGIAP